MGWIILTILTAIIAVPAVIYAVFTKATYPKKLEAWEAGGKYGDMPTNYYLVGWATAQARES